VGSCKNLVGSNRYLEGKFLHNCSNLACGIMAESVGGVIFPGWLS
jgi:hypothetical protein